MSSRFIYVVSYGNISFLLKVPEFFYWMFMPPLFFLFYLSADHWVVSIIPVSPHTPSLFRWAFGMNAATALRKRLAHVTCSVNVNCGCCRCHFISSGWHRQRQTWTSFGALLSPWVRVKKHGYFFFHVILPPWGKDNLATDLINRGTEKVTPGTDDACRLFCWFSQTHAIYCLHLENTFIVNCPQKIHPDAIQCSTFNQGTK